jgi:hypothetical protein
MKERSFLRRRLRNGRGIVSSTVNGGASFLQVHPVSFPFSSLVQTSYTEMNDAYAICHCKNLPPCLLQIVPEQTIGGHKPSLPPSKSNSGAQATVLPSSSRRNVALRLRTRAISLPLSSHRMASSHPDPQRPIHIQRHIQVSSRRMQSLCTGMRRQQVEGRQTQTRSRSCRIQSLPHPML